MKSRAAAPASSAKRLADARPAILLSASVPYDRRGVSRQPAGGSRATSPVYLETMQPARIRSAVLALTRAALRRGARLVFGAHPAISPMVLSAARDAHAPRGSIVIFQSRFFRADVPASTLDLASWEAGVLVWTEAAPGPRGAGAVPEAEQRARSLTRMRRQMVSFPGLRGAIFVGGMEGVEEEAELFRQQNERLPRYALASTGSAALKIWMQSQGRDFMGGLNDRAVLTDVRSYSVVAKRILDDLRIG